MYIWLILLILLVGYFLDFSLAMLEIRALDPALPNEFVGSFDADEYARSQGYTKARTRLSVVKSTVVTSLTLAFLLLGGFNGIDLVARRFGVGEIPTGLIYIGSLLLLFLAINLPFSLYSTFVIEERYGFNRTTITTFALDLCKTLALSLVLGGPLLALILWFFQATGELAWLYCWAGVVIFSMIVQLLAPVLILPLFNRFSPLEEGPLKQAIFDYAHAEGFRLQGIYTMDGSRRSAKLNAFFTGFGPFRKIVFFDTLLEKLEQGEILAVLAHEMGHWRHHHLGWMLLASTLQTGLMFYLLSLVIGNVGLFAAFHMAHISIYASLVFFSFLFWPVNLILSTAGNALSRINEYQADRYACRPCDKSTHMITSLKKLAQANLANLTPHPLVVFFQYSHPPILERIRAIRKICPPAPCSSPDALP